jgi:hypothetical protein
MKRLGAALILAVLLAGFAHPVFADQSEAKEVARNNNCLPKKIDIYQQSMGTEGQTVYIVQCNVPKTTDQAAAGPDALLIACRDSLCTLLRPYDETKK